ncbi:Ldh family oxidoreductase [Candidatus Poribacteria bacterium]|nr:Ldh family oxidoreductase [Candidatus Poribacteria bacterium]
MRISIHEARQLAENFLMGGGMPPADAQIVADILLEAELRGRKTHGFIRLPGIKNRYAQVEDSRNGEEQSDIRVVREAGHWALIDGGNQPGYLVAYRAMEHAIQRSGAHGSALVGVYNTSHCGMAGYYADMARKADRVALLFADCLPRITAFGGTEAILGTNPLAVGIPSNTIPVLLDMSTASITNGDLLVAMREGKPIAEGLAFDPQGNPTTHPSLASKGSVRPFGGHKGFGLALIIQILAGALVNAATIPPPGINYGLLMIVIDPSTFVPIETFKREVDALLERLKSTRREEGVEEIFIPGERAYRERAQRLESGIELEEDLLAQLRPDGASVSG